MYASSNQEYEQWKEKLEENGGKWEGALARRSLIQADGSIKELTPMEQRSFSNFTGPTTTIAPPEERSMSPPISR